MEANSRRLTIKAGGDDERSGVASKSASASSLDSITEKCKKIDTAERSKRLQELKAKSVAQLMEANKKSYRDQDFEGQGGVDVRGCAFGGRHRVGVRCCVFGVRL